MKRWIKSAALVWLSVVTVTSAFAQPATEYVSASQEFERLTSQTMKDRGMPRLENKRAAELIATLSDSERFLHSKTYQLKDLDSLMNMCDKANAVVMSYALFDVKNNIDPKDDPKLVTRQVATIMERNIQTFQDELEQLQPFLIHCMSKQIPLLNKFMLSLKPEAFTEIRRTGLQKARDGLFNAYYGFLKIANNPALKETYRVKVLKAMAETSTQYSSMLQPAARRQIFDLAKLTQTTVPKILQVHLENIAAAMANTSCNGLCKF